MENGKPAVKAFALWIDLSDRRYARRLQEYLQRYYASSMVPALTEKREWLQEGFEAGKGILLTDEVLSEAEKQKASQIFSDLLVVHLQEQIPQQPDRSSSTLDLYQNASRIASRILEIWHRHDQPEQAPKLPAEPETGTAGRRVRENVPLLSSFGGQGLVVSVYSPLGGIGKSSVAWCLCGQLSASAPTLYLCTEGYDGFMPSEEPDKTSSFLGVCYSLLAEPEQTLERRLQQIPRQEENGCFFLPPLTDPDDLLELDRSSLQKLLEKLSDRFSYIVIDLGSCLIYPARFLLEQSACRIYLTDLCPQSSSRFHKAGAPAVRPGQDIVLVRTQGTGRTHCRQKTKDRLPEQADTLVLPEEDSLLESGASTPQWRTDTAWYRTIQQLAGLLQTKRAHRREENTKHT